ncbi:MAG TPA: SMC-Scp complex subunit ScpB, partial [Candidatus Altiarchaeales archaeon]|nr:SMC-Scp complex subunit ScpB [Candidatus Altiarchaeales archaeon]
ELENLIQEYRNRNSAIEIRKTTEGYQMTVKEELESYVIDLVTKTELPKALIKTLAFIAYKEPVPQSEVIKVRGNKAYHYIKELIAKGFIEAKKKGKTKVLCTTKKFKEYFQVEKLENAR